MRLKKQVIPLAILTVACLVGGGIGISALVHAHVSAPAGARHSRSSFETPGGSASRTPSQASSDTGSSAADASAASSGTGGKIAYLTFDDGPSEYTPTLLGILQKENIKATFFITFVGHDSAQKRAWLSEEAADGETMGVHSWTHNYKKIYASAEAFRYDYATMRKIMIDTTGIVPQVCRFPGGTGNTVSITASHGKVFMPTAVSIAESLGLKPFDWNAGGEDAELPYPTSAQFVRDILRDAKGKTRIVILMHDSHLFSVQAVPELVSALRAQGYGFGVLTASTPSMREPYAAKSARSSKIKG